MSEILSNIANLLNGTKERTEFLSRFDDKMQELNGIKEKIQSTIQFRQAFTSNLKTKLQQVNTRLKDLADLIRTLKEKADSLQTTVDTNKSSIDEREQRLQALQQEIVSLKQERDSLNARMEQERQATEAKMRDQQAKIDGCEAQLRDVKQEKEAAEVRAQALDNELKSRGDQQAAHADELKRVQDANKAQLDQQERDLLARINECEQKMQGFQQQINDKETANKDLQDRLTTKHTESSSEAERLQNEIAALKSENEMLIQRLIAASKAISDAVENLQMLTDNVPDVQNQQEVDQLLKGITDQIEESIINISRATQGQRPVVPPPPPLGEELPIPPPLQNQGSLYKLPLNTNITLTDLYNNKPVTMPFSELIKLIERKARQPGVSDVYRRALTELQSANNQQEVLNAMRNKVSLKNGIIMGGRRTRKNRKQKGGFTYNKNSKRRQITMRTTHRRSSSKTSKNSK